jgi:Transglycosylase SLT domain
VAGEIFVGSVAVSVVPDLRGFNDRVRSELVPSADAIGRDIGKAISKGISDNLSVTKVALDELRRKITDGLKDIKANVSVDVTNVNLDDVRRKINDGLKDIKVNVDLGVTDAKIAETRAKIRDGLRDIKVNVDTSTSSSSRIAADVRSGVSGGFGATIARLFGRGGGTSGGGIGAGGGGGSGTAAAAAGGASGQFLRGNQLAGIATAFGELPLPAQIGIVSAALAALPFVAQVAAGGIVTALGGAFLAVGIYAAAQTKQVQAAWAKFMTGTKAGIQEIGQAFAPVVVNIINTLGPVADKLGDVLVGVLKVIGPPFQVFADTLIKGLASPHVVAAMQEIGVAFAGLLKAFAPDIPGIINSMADAFERLAASVAKNPKAFADFINFMFQIVILIVNGIAYLTDFADYIEFHFMPALAHFVNFWIIVGHDIESAWDTTWNNTVGRTERGLHDIAALFDKQRHDVAASVNQTGADVNNIWRSIWNNTVGRAIRGVQDTIHAVDGIMGVLNTWDHLNSQSARLWNILWQVTVGQVVTGTRHVISDITFFVNQVIGLWLYLGRSGAAIWNQIWSNTVSQAVNGYRKLLPVFDTIGRMVTIAWDNILHFSNLVWNQIWSQTIGLAIRGVQNLINVFNTIRPRVVSALNTAGSWLVGVGESIIGGMLNGIDRAMANVGSWLKAHVVDPIVNAVKHFFGISSPATVMVPIGANIMQGVIQGMLTSGANLGKLVGTIFGGWPQALGSLVSKSMVDLAHLPAKAINALGSIAGKAGSFFGSMWHKVFGGSGGVNQWAGTVMQALAMLHLPMSLLGQVLYQMQTESGGNPNAINLTDINAQMGDPSRGLLQVIGTTFGAYHVAGTSGNIYDPLANVAAAINYAMHRYGPGLMSGGMGMGSGHGYDAGGYAPPGASWFWNGTGKPEPVLTDAQWNAIYSAARGGDGGVQYHAHFDGLTGAAIESHVQTAFKAMSLTAGALNRQGRRS